VREDLELLPDPDDESCSLSGLRLLVVDDMADALDTFGMILELCGAHVVCASSGFEALALCEQSRFDLVVSDIGMPGMSGVELITELRRKPATAEMPAIALTGYGRQEDVRKAMAAGFSGHLVKPAEIEDVRRMIQRLTGGLKP
jgi:two-component system CheB/CheR fusion protein